MDDKHIIVKWSGGCRELHPKSRHSFTDKNGQTHESVEKAFTAITEGRNWSFHNLLEILFRVILCQAEQVKEIKAIFLASVGKQFFFESNDPKYLPGSGWGVERMILKTQTPMTHDTQAGVFWMKGSNHYGQMLAKVRDCIVNRARSEVVTTSRGPVPAGSQPCQRCGGDGSEAGSGYWAAVADGSAIGWKHVGPCFDCLPKDRKNRGLGYITRSLARKNLTYRTHNKLAWDDNHHQCENEYDPNNDSLWTVKQAIVVHEPNQEDRPI